MLHQVYAPFLFVPFEGRKEWIELGFHWLFSWADSLSGA